MIAVVGQRVPVMSDTTISFRGRSYPNTLLQRGCKAKLTFLPDSTFARERTTQRVWSAIQRLHAIPVCVRPSSEETCLMQAIQ